MVQDNDYGTWDAYGNQYWPANCLIDADGNVRYLHLGEGEYEETEQAIRTLLRDAGRRRPRRRRDGERRRDLLDQTHDPGELSRLSSRRALRQRARSSPGPRTSASAQYQLPPEHLAYNGTWEIAPDGATAGADASLGLSFNAKQVFLVLGSTDRPRPLRVELDGKPVPKALAGADVRHGVADDQPPAPLPPDRSPTGRPPQADPALRARDLRLRVHLRLGRLFG